MEIYYTDQGKRIGPISVENLQSLYRSRQINLNTSVWVDSAADWCELSKSSIYGLVSDIKQDGPPPLRGDSINNTYVWALAFAPLIGYFLESIASESFNKPIDELWYITLALNIGLSFLDEKKLEAAGVDTSRFSAFAILVPVYLFLRFRVLDQKPYYFITWIVTLLISLSET